MSKNNNIICLLDKNNIMRAKRTKPQPFMDYAVYSLHRDTRE